MLRKNSKHPLYILKRLKKIGLSLYFVFQKIKSKKFIEAL